VNRAQERRCRGVVDIPEAGDDGWDTRSQEVAGEAEVALHGGGRSGGGAAGGQDDEASAVQTQIGEVHGAEQVGALASPAEL